MQYMGVENHNRYPTEIKKPKSRSLKSLLNQPLQNQTTQPKSKKVLNRILQTLPLIAITLLKKQIKGIMKGLKNGQIK